MRKMTYLLFSLLLVGLTVLSWRQPASELHLFLTVNKQLTTWRLALASVMFLYAVVPFFRRTLGRYLLGLAGIGLLTLACVSFFTTTLFGRFVYLLPIDLFICVEGGALGLLAFLQSSAAPSPKVIQPQTLRALPQTAEFYPIKASL